MSRVPSMFLPQSFFLSSLPLSLANMNAPFNCFFLLFRPGTFPPSLLHLSSRPLGNCRSLCQSWFFPIQRRVKKGLGRAFPPSWKAGLEANQASDISETTKEKWEFSQVQGFFELLSFWTWRTPIFAYRDLKEPWSIPIDCVCVKMSLLFPIKDVVWFLLCRSFCWGIHVWLFFGWASSSSSFKDEAWLRHFTVPSRCIVACVKIALGMQS